MPLCSIFVGLPYIFGRIYSHASCDHKINFCDHKVQISGVLAQIQPVLPSLKRDSAPQMALFLSQQSQQTEGGRHGRRE